MLQFLVRLRAFEEFLSLFSNLPYFIDQCVKQSKHIPVEIARPLVKCSLVRYENRYVLLETKICQTIPCISSRKVGDFELVGIVLPIELR